MRFETAKELLLSEGYRIVSEDFEDEEVLGTDVAQIEDTPDIAEEPAAESDVYVAVEQGLGDEGFDATEIADIMVNYGEKIEDLANKGVDVEDIIKIVAYDKCPECEDGECEGPECDPAATEVPMDESKSREKSDRFSHKQKVAYKKKKCEECDDDDDEEMDESIEPDNGWEESNKKYGSLSEFYDVLIGRGYNFKSARAWIDANMNKIVMFKRKGYSAEDIVYELDGDLAGDMDESLEDVPGLIREPRGQVGRDDWDDFKDDFRKKTLFLKKALTPKFVSGIIKDTDFEVDDKEIKEYAFSVIEDVFETKNPVENLQARIRKHFVK